jgi:proline iminopeptidase
MPGYFFDREKALIVSQDMKDSDFNFDMGNWIWMDIEKNYLKMGDTKSNFEKPVLIIQGRQDPIGENAAIKISNYYKRSKVVYIERSGHYLWVEQPDNVLTSITSFLKIDR